MLVITSEQRVGSRWIGYLLADMLTQQNPTPEITLAKYPNPKAIYQEVMGRGRILKLHGDTPMKIIGELGSRIKLLGIVRDPRDRLLSLCFHKRYHPYHGGFNEKKKKTDLEALEQTVVNDPADNRNNFKMLEYMIPNHSTRALKDTTNYVWTTYEWLKEDTEGEIVKILKALSIPTHEKIVNHYVQKYTFKQLTGREEGVEDRRNSFARKGIVGDWTNWFTEEMIEVTEEIHNEYYRRVNSELD